METVKPECCYLFLVTKEFSQALNFLLVFGFLFSFWEVNTGSMCFDLKQ